jgi:hypothetical protein
LIGAQLSPISAESVLPPPEADVPMTPARRSQQTTTSGDAALLLADEAEDRARRQGAVVLPAAGGRASLSSCGGLARRNRLGDVGGVRIRLWVALAG